MFSRFPSLSGQLLPVVAAPSDALGELIPPPSSWISHSSRNSCFRAKEHAHIPTMFAATGRWFRRNRTPIAIGLGVIGAGYVVTQYVISKINDARERMSSDRIAKEK
jgi:hypothetical protein